MTTAEFAGYAFRHSSKRVKTAVWLAAALSWGPADAKQLLKTCTEMGISRATLHRAARDVGVTKRKLGFLTGYWEWSLPPVIGSIGMDPLLECTQACLEDIEYVQVKKS